MPEFKIADGFVEIEAELDRNQIRRAATQAGDESGEAFTRALRRRADRSGPGAGSHMAASFMGGFARDLFKPNAALLSAMRTGIPAVLSSPVGAAGAAVAAIFIGSFVSAVLASGALLTLGGGILALGAFGVSSAKEVQEAWSGMTRKVSSSFREAASGLVGPFSKAIDKVGDFFEDNIAPKLRAIFDDMAPSILPAFEALTETADRFLGAIAGRFDELSPVFNQMMAQLPRLGDAAGRFVNTLIDHGPEIAEAFESIVDMTVNVIDALDDIIVAGTKVFNFFVDMKNLVTTLFGTNPFSNLQRGLELAQKGFLNFTPVGMAVRAMFGDMTRETGFANAAIKDLTASTGPVRGSFSGWTSITDTLTDTIFDATVATNGLYDALMILNGGALAARAAENQFEQAIDAATEAVRNNGATLDVNTDKGRANRGALDAIATSAMRSASAEYELSGSVQNATGIMQRGRDELIRSARQMGLNQREAEQLADEIMGVPRSWKTTFSSNADRVRSGVDAIRSAIARLSNKTVTITTVHRNVGENFAFRYGGVHMAQDGLVKLGNRSRMFPGGRTLFGFSEPGTGGEAFIARNAPRDRSLGILRTAAAWHDALLVPAERMASSAAALSRGMTRGGDGATYNFAPGSIVVDASRLRAVDDLIRMLEGLRTTSRQFGARTVMT